MVSYEMLGANTLTPPMNWTHGLSLAERKAILIQMLDRHLMHADVPQESRL